MRLATLVRCLFALFPPSSSAPGEQSERSSQREFVRAPIPMHDYVYIPLYIFPGNTWLAVWERDETGPVSGEMLIARCFEETWGCFGRRIVWMEWKWNFNEGGRGGRGNCAVREKYRYYRCYFVIYGTGANVQFVITIIRKWATWVWVYSIMRYCHAFGKIWRSLENMYFVTRPF